MTRLLLIANDVFGEHMAGPAIRYWEMARALRTRCEVILAIPPFVAEASHPPARPWIRRCTDEAQLRALVAWSEIIVTLGIVPRLYPFITRAGKPLVIDLYDPALLEELARHPQWATHRRVGSYARRLEAMWHSLRAGDFFLCAEERQRDYWLGMLSAAGRLNPYTYDDDPSFRRLIDLLPFGLPAEPPQHRHPVLKGHHPAIGAADKVILWGGGLWPWFDAPTLVRAMPHILKVRSDVRLLFLGVQRPGHRAPSPTVEAVIALSRQLGLEEHVVFGGWVPYAERENYLLEADVGVSLHLDNVETRFAFRTRLLDYLWAGLPIVATMGDPLGERLADADLAIPVAPGDARGVAQAIVQALGRPREAVRRKAEALAPRFYWDRVVQPLVDFCNAPHLAADKGKPPFILTRSSRRTLWEKVRFAYRTGGIEALIAELRNRRA